MKMIKIIGLILILISINTASAAWLLNNYDCREKIIITGNTSGAQTDYQLLVNITYDSNMQADFDDLRFTNNTHQIDAWLESKVDSSYANIWIEFPTTPANGVNQSYYMYYGNADIESEWNITNTFLFGDGFSGTSIDTNKWDGYITGATVSGGLLSYRGNTISIQYLRSINQFGTTCAFRSKTKFRILENHFQVFGFENPDNTHYTKGYIDSTPSKYLYSKDGGTSSFVETNWVMESYEIIDIIIRGGINGAWYQDSVQCTNSPKTTNPSNTNDLEVIFGAKQDYMTNCEIYVDWVLVRKYVINPPTYIFEEETKYIKNFNNLFESENSWHMLSSIFGVYESVCGATLFWLIIILIPFTMTWIKTQSVIIPSILALITGSTLFVLLPATAIGTIKILMVIGVAGLLYHIIKSR